MLKPRVEIRKDEARLHAEFWDCFRLDLAPVQELRQHFDEHVRSGGEPRLLIDLSGVDFAGSAVLGMLLTIQRSARANGGRVVLYNVDPNILEVFKISKLEPFFTFVETLEEARSIAQQAVASQVPTSGDSTRGQVDRAGVDSSGEGRPLASRIRRTSSSPPPLRRQRKAEGS